MLLLCWLKTIITTKIITKLNAVIPIPVQKPTRYFGACVVMNTFEDTKFAQSPKPSWIAVPKDLEADLED
jgi:hypothetical protein